VRVWIPLSATPFGRFLLPWPPVLRLPFWCGDLETATAKKMSKPRSNQTKWNFKIKKKPRRGVCTRLTLFLAGVFAEEKPP